MYISEVYWDKRWQEMIDQESDVYEKMKIESIREKWRRIAFPENSFDVHNGSGMDFVRDVIRKYAN